MKFEKILKKFCKDIGVDKKTLLTMMIGGRDLEVSNTKSDLNSSVKEKINQVDTLAKDSVLNTGVAA